MLYGLFLLIAFLYNWRKYARDKHSFLNSLIEAKNLSHREMILAHHFHVFILEVFLALIVAHLIAERSVGIGILGFGFAYVVLLFAGFFMYYFFVRHLERSTGMILWESFKKHIIQEVRVSFAVIMLPILIYAMMNWTFQDGLFEEWGSLWFIGIFFNIIFISVLTVVCTVIIMLRLIPNREITEPEYLNVINHRLQQIGLSNLRVRWIETDIKNAFVVGLSLVKFSNQTLFVGRKLRTMLTIEEFDAVIAHELAHVANRHIHKRMIVLLKNFLSVVFGLGFLMLVVIGLSLLYWNEDVSLHTHGTSGILFVVGSAWLVFNYSLLFDTIRSHEYEADAFAVINLGVAFDNLASALTKLTTPDELPEYLKLRTQRKISKTPWQVWVRKNFSTHPEVSERLENLRLKIEKRLPFNHYVSTAHKISGHLWHLFEWKVALPMVSVFVCFLVWSLTTYRDGEKNIAFIQKASPAAIIARKDFVPRINSRPHLIGPSLMYFIVKKQDPGLIDYFLGHGADPARTLVYISQLKNYDLFHRYYARYQGKLSDEEFFLVLRKTAHLNFTQGYRLLVNGKRFEALSPDHKEDLTRMHRKPASK